MSLTRYKEKRDFKKTPEPAGKKKKTGKELKFFVQRHFARNLHYDLRLEMEGVLKSWAVPKGPPMVAGEKRLAIMVEDHPMEYGDFFGEIPEGNYGAGMVELFDKGVYEPPEESSNPEKLLLSQLKKGDLKLKLTGKQLKGLFALVKLKNAEDNQWLLIKKDDEHALKSFNIDEIKALKSKGKGKPAKGRKSGKAKPKAHKEALLQEIPSPMLAKLSKDIVDRNNWVYEIKYDGYRMISSVDGKEVKLLSRNRKSFNEKYEPIAKEMKKISDKVILDGEVVIEDKEGRSDFQRLQNYNTTLEGELKYYVFDILFLNGQSTLDMPLLQRKELLGAFFSKYKLKNISNAHWQQGGGKEFFKELSSQGFEGVIAKAPESTYLPGRRSDSWLKVKAIRMQEAVICGYTSPQKGRKHFGSLILGVYEDDKLEYIGNAGTGFNDASLKELHEEMQKHLADESPFDTVPKMGYTKGKPSWLEPRLVCNVKFTEWSQEGRLRHPVFMGLRTDKEAHEVEREEMQVAEIKKEDWPKEKVFTISGKKVKCTNLNKVFWPEEGYTKGDLIAYYQAVSRYIVPYLKERPQSLNRHPNGIKGKSFFHKNMEVKQLPEWVETHKVYSKSNKDHIDYLLCNDAATLVYMANLGCIEINPWHSTWKNPDNPTYMMLDLDPAKIPFTEVVNTALVIKEICDETNIACYCKTSGATGLHIYIPLGGRYNYDQVKNFAELLAVLTHQRLPDVTSIERSTSKRKDKVYVDFLQNRKAQTLAAAYSVRPRPGATVSAPLKWEEVNKNLSPAMFTIKNMIQRLEKEGDLWSPILKEGVNVIKAIDAIDKLF